MKTGGREDGENMKLTTPSIREQPQAFLGRQSPQESPSCPGDIPVGVLCPQNAHTWLQASVNASTTVLKKRYVFPDCPQQRSQGVQV
jgi:hypothetical protein